MFTTVRAVIHYKTKMIFAEVAPEKVAFDSFGHFHSLPIQLSVPLLTYSKRI